MAKSYDPKLIIMLGRRLGGDVSPSVGLDQRLDTADQNGFAPMMISILRSQRRGGEGSKQNTTAEAAARDAAIADKLQQQRDERMQRIMESFRYSDSPAYELGPSMIPAAQLPWLPFHRDPTGAAFVGIDQTNLKPGDLEFAQQEIEAERARQALRQGQPLPPR